MLNPGPIVHPHRFQKNAGLFWGFSMKILTWSLFLISALGCMLILGIPGAAAAPTQKTVLVFSPFQIDLSTNLIAAQAMRDEFKLASDLKIDIFYEYLDLNRFPGPEFQEEIFNHLAAKYKNKQVDLVIIGSEAMLKLWLEYHDGILPGVPVVFFFFVTENH